MYCGKCGQRIADDSRFCKFCGSAQKEESMPSGASKYTPKVTPNPKDRSLKIIGVIIAVVVLLITIGSLSSPAPNGAQANSSDADGSASNVVGAPAATASEAPDNWTYSTDTDQVRGGTTYYATTTSANSIHQDFPYSSSTTMNLTLRKSPAYGTDVMLQISSGQMMCPSYEGCSGTVRFDNGPPQRIEFNGPEDSSSDVVFVRGAKAFIAKLAKAKKVVVEKTLYQAGAPQFEFDVSGLKWGH